MNGGPKNREVHYVLKRKKGASGKVSYEYAIVSNNMYLGKYNQTWKNYEVVGKFSHEMEINCYCDQANLAERLDSLGETIPQEKDNLKAIREKVLEGKTHAGKQG
ncbi:MAG: hypothetical protein QXU82_00040 [Candidatus Aenigmatarchaeota archaeon]